MKYPIQKRAHLIKDVSLPSLTFQSEPHCGQRDIWWGGGGGGGGEVSEGSDMYLGFCFYFEQAHFVMFSGLLVVLFVKLLYCTTYFFQNWTHFAPFFFFWVLPN